MLVSVPGMNQPDGGQVVVLISGEHGDPTKGNKADTEGNRSFSSVHQDNLAQKAGKAESLDRLATPRSWPSPEINQLGSSCRRPPKIPNKDAPARQGLLKRPVISRPKSRFGEPPVDTNLFEENTQMLADCDEYASSSPYWNLSNTSSPIDIMGAAVTRTPSIAPTTPLMSSPVGGEDGEVEEIYRKVNGRMSKKHRKIKSKVLSEWVAFLFIAGCLAASLANPELKIFRLWGLQIWKWCLLTMAIFSGMLFSKWFIHILVFLIERNFLLKKKVMYFFHGLKNSVKVFIWLCLVLLTWLLLFNNNVKHSKFSKNLTVCITSTLRTVVIGGFLWLLKNLLLKILASNFHVNRFFDRIQESIFHQYVLQILSWPIVIEIGGIDRSVCGRGQLSFWRKKSKKGGKENNIINMTELHSMDREKVSAWTMKQLIDVAFSRLSTISHTLDESVCDCITQADKEITSQMEAVAAAYRIFKNVARPNCKYIDEDDLLRFMSDEDVELVFSLFEGSKLRQIDKKSLTKWLVKVYNGRKALVHALTDTKTAVKQLNKLVTGIVVVVIVVIWLVLMGIVTTKVLVFLSSQLVVAAFMFGNTCKTLFEAIIFVFVIHPFDVGDRCVVDGVQMIVEEMNILTTVFLKYDNEKIYYPNSILSSKPISNFYRSPDMADSVDFSIDFMTPIEKIGTLRDKIKKYIEGDPQHWHKSHSVLVKEIEDVNKLTMALYLTHTMNFQDFEEKTKRRSDLVIEMKRIFEELNIRYTLLPQEVNLSHQ